MERLTRKTEEEFALNNGIHYLANATSKKVLNKLGEYEDAEEQGLLLRLPCKVGDTLWWANAYGDLCTSEVNSMFIEQGIDGIVIETFICNINGKEIGKTVFLNREQAEKKINE